MWFSKTEIEILVNGVCENPPGPALQTARQLVVDKIAGKLIGGDTSTFIYEIPKDLDLSIPREFAQAMARIMLANKPPGYLNARKPTIVEDLYRGKRTATFIYPLDPNYKGETE